MLGVIGIILSLGLLMFFAYRGINVMVLAPIMALMAVLVGGEVQLLLPTYTQVFMRELGGYLIKFSLFFSSGRDFRQADGELWVGGNYRPHADSDRDWPECAIDVWFVPYSRCHLFGSTKIWRCQAVRSG